MLFAVEETAGGFLADAIDGDPARPLLRAAFQLVAARDNAVDGDAVFGDAAKILANRVPLAVLLEEERRASRCALVAKIARPADVHRPRLRSALAADDRPIEPRSTTMLRRRIVVRSFVAIIMIVVLVQLRGDRAE